MCEIFPPQALTPAWVEAMIEERKTAKALNNRARDDEIRKELTGRHILLKDNPWDNFLDGAGLKIRSDDRKNHST